MKKLVGLALLIAAGLAYADGNQGASADPDPLLLRTSIDLTYEYHLRSPTSSSSRRRSMLR